MEAEFAREVLTRLPLTEAVLSLWRWVADPLFLLSVFTRHCGVGYEKEIRFGVLEQLIVDALLEHQGSGRKSFERGREQRLLTASIQAVYQKVGRISLGLSEAWLAESTARVRPVYPSVAGVPLPSSRQGLEVILVDGKAIKRAAKRLKPLQGRKGGVLGGKALVALELRRRLAVDMATNPDGETNDAKRVPTLLPQVRAHVAGARLWGPIGSSVTSPRRRPLPQGRITPRALSSQDSLLPRGAAARTVWAGCSGAAVGRRLGCEQAKQRRFLRRITLSRPGEETIILLTDLLDAQQFPANDLLSGLSNKFLYIFIVPV